MKPGPRRPKTDIGDKKRMECPCLPLEERPKTKRTRQSWGLSIVMESQWPKDLSSSLWVPI